ncbi:glycoside hydrolase domain-containing protein [uncultured Granulicatella sp.]|uniref:glycoside hydrolase domain-containing protein n=1 Tax=uncultured Granulicatella sp. TaxID=316089 RepID=UPI0028D16EF9|nr:glycoside hydrolase domain-containing protein [uncultured Granulicatella sp.]
MDQNVKNAQRYLNAMFGGHSEWVELEENGNTGSLMMEGLIRAFQINNGISPATGFVGPRTIAKMKVLPIMERMDPDGDTSVNAALVQAALFAKGYNAGGITGIFYNAGVRAVRELQSDAGLFVTGRVNWKVWAGLFSMNWFKKVSSGDETVRLIQRQLNSEWSDIIGVGPCDGVASRQTILSLVGALQAAEGVTYELIDDLNELNFGPSTTRNFPGVLRNGQNGGNYTKFNKLVQYGLYFNGYNPGRFDGVFDGQTENQVRAFQEFYALLGTGRVTAGEVNVSTMKSLLTSKGDTERSAKACDCATVLNRQQALDLKAAGYTHVGRYLTGFVGRSTSKAITHDEINHIKNAGLSLFPIYQDGGYYLEYFQNSHQGLTDGKLAIEAAENLGIPSGTTIYFAVDFDAYEYQIDNFIIPYFRMIDFIFKTQLNKKRYKVGVYGARLICTKVSDRGLASYSFVGDMSTGFSGNLGYSIPKNWAFDQFYEQDFTSNPTFPIDKDAYSGRDKGASTFDVVPQKSAKQLEQENAQRILDYARMQFIHDILNPLGYLNGIVTTGISYNKKVKLANYSNPVADVEVSMTVGGQASTESDSEYKINISVDNEGKLSAETENQLSTITTGINLEKLGDFKEKLESIALSVKSGTMTFKITPLPPNKIVITVTTTSDDLLPENPKVNESVSCELEYEFTFKNRRINPEFNISTESILIGVGTVAVIALVALAFSTGVGEVITALSTLVSAGVSLFAH